MGSVCCQALKTVPDKRRVSVGGLVLVRQRPGTAKGVVFLTLEDETGIANIVVWSAAFEANRRIVMGASFLLVHGQVQREGDVIHVVADQLTDLSDMLRRVGDRPDDEAFPLRAGRGDEAKHGGSPDPRDDKALRHHPAATEPDDTALGRKPRDIYIPDLRLGSGIKVQTRDFR